MADSKRARRQKQQTQPKIDLTNYEPFSTPPETFSAFCNKSIRRSEMTTGEIGKRLGRDPSMTSRLYRDYEGKRDRQRGERNSAVC
jgi:hypothetical protein